MNLAMQSPPITCPPTASAHKPTPSQVEILMAMKTTPSCAQGFWTPQLATRRHRGFRQLHLPESDGDYDSSGPDDDDAEFDQDSLRVHGGVRSEVYAGINIEADLSYTTYDREFTGTEESVFDSTDAFGSVRATFAVDESIDLTTAIDSASRCRNRRRISVLKSMSEGHCRRLDSG